MIIKKITIKSKLTVIVPQPIADAFNDAKELWDLLAQRMSLAPIVERVPYAPHPVWFGVTEEAVFFVTPLRKTKQGFTCQISIFPHGKICLGFAGWAGWIKRNLLLDQPVKEIRWEEGKGWTFRTKTGVSFVLEDTRMRLTD